MKVPASNVRDECESRPDGRNVREVLLGTDAKINTRRLNAPSKSGCQGSELILV